MGKSEGLTRFSDFIRIIAFVLLLVAAYVCYSNTGEGRWFGFALYGVPAALLWGIAWIVEGFAE